MTREQAEAEGRAWLGSGVPFRVVRSERGRRVRLRVRAGTVELAVPAGASYAEALRLLAGHRVWALRTWEAHRVIAEREEAAAEARRGSVWLRGEPHSLAGAFATRGRVAVVPSGLWVEAPDEAAADRALVAWFRQEASRDVAEAVARWSPRLGVRPAKVSVRDQRTKWGAATSRGTVTFNWRLVMAPPVVLEYVVVHELAHLIEMNHSPRFWAIVERFIPEWRTHRDWLRRHQAELAALPRIAFGQTAAASASLRA